MEQISIELFQLKPIIIIQQSINIIDILVGLF